MDKKHLTENLIKLTKINKWYKTKTFAYHALKNVSLEIKKGEFVAIMGTSGSGKSTLMNIIGCLDRFESGSYKLCNKDVTKFSDDELSKFRGEVIGFIFQSFNLINRYSVLENVTMPSLYVSVKNPKQKAEDLLDKVGLKGKIRNKPTELSGGQRQRVAIARALMCDPEIILADEPTGNLDSTSGKEVMKMITDLNEEGKTIVLITHDLNIAKYAKRTIYLKDGEIVDGKVYTEHN